LISTQKCSEREEVKKGSTLAMRIKNPSAKKVYCKPLIQARTILFQKTLIWQEKSSKVIPKENSRK
jgi:hypothetical protein